MYVGIDLAALPENETGMAAYDGRRYFCHTAYSDEEILRFILDMKPSVVAIDAPLTLPKGRCCFDDACCGTRKIRECDRALIRMGYRVFPPGFSFMKQLTLRGRALRERLFGFKVIEVHPRTSKRILGIERFEEAGSEHESDACAAALTAFLYDRGQCVQVGDDEGIIVIPAGKGTQKKLK